MVADGQALRLSAVHLGGIETLYQGDDDLELRLSEAGLDVLKRSNGAAIGRLEWSEIETVSLPAPKRGLRNRRRSRELHVSTGRGQAQFELPGLTDDELHEHLEPTLARLRGTDPTDTRARATPAESDSGTPPAARRARLGPRRRELLGRRARGSLLRPMRAASAGGEHAGAGVRARHRLPVGGPHRQLDRHVS